MMNLQTLPPELVARILAYTDCRTITKIRRNNYGFNSLAKRLNLHIPIVNDTLIMKVLTIQSDLRSEILARVGTGWEVVEGRSTCRYHEAVRIKNYIDPDMSLVYNQLFMQIRGTRNFSFDEIVIDVRFLDALKSNKIDISKTVLVAIDCVFNLSINQAIALFSSFKKVVLRNCQLSSNLLSDEVFSVIVSRNVELILYFYDGLQKYPSLTDNVLMALQNSPNLLNCKLDIEQCSTAFTFARIKKIVLEIANTDTFHSADINFGYLNGDEQISVRYGIDELMSHPKIELSHDFDMRYVWIVVSDVKDGDETTGVYARSEFRFYVGSKMLKYEQQNNENSDEEID